VDTNILFYAYDRNSGARHERAQELMTELWSSEQGMLSTQVLQEFCVNIRRKANVSAQTAKLLVQDFLKWKVVINTGESVLGALEIESRHQISFWDALVIYAAQVGGAQILYSENLSDGQI
jgi:predicted nucleic acid-binding protein